MKNSPVKRATVQLLVEEAPPLGNCNFHTVYFYGHVL